MNVSQLMGNLNLCALSQPLAPDFFFIMKAMNIVKREPGEVFHNLNRVLPTKKMIMMRSHNGSDDESL